MASGISVVSVLSSMSWRVQWEDGSSEQIIGWIFEADGSIHAVVNDRGLPVWLERAEQQGRVFHPSYKPGRDDEGLQSEPEGEAALLLDTLSSSENDAMNLRDIAAALQLTWSKSTRDHLAGVLERLKKQKKVQYMTQGQGLPVLFWKSDG